MVAHSYPEKYEHFKTIGFRPSQQLKRYKRHWDLLRAGWKRFDAVILERELFDNPSVDIELRFRRIAKTMVLDVDDAIFCRYPNKAIALAKMVDVVLAGNRLLAEWASQFSNHVEWMPTCIDTDQYKPASNIAPLDKALVIGWVGTSSNIRNLEVVVAALRETARNYRFEFRVISNERGVLDSLDLQGVNVRFEEWSAERETAQLRELDIGIMPLIDDQWSQYKCGAKLLQYMALGIPGIASPVGVNGDILIHGQNGYLASTTEQWNSAFAKLLVDRNHRHSLGEVAIQTVVKKFSIQTHLPRWISIIEAAVNRNKLR